MNFRVFFIIIVLAASAQILASESDGTDDLGPNMEQEILRQLEQINGMGKTWDQKLEKARSQSNKTSKDDEELGKIM